MKRGQRETPIAGVCSLQPAVEVVGEPLGRLAASLPSARALGLTSVVAKPRVYAPLENRPADCHRRRDGVPSLVDLVFLAAVARPAERIGKPARILRQYRCTREPNNLPLAANGTSAKFHRLAGSWNRCQSTVAAPRFFATSRRRPGRLANAVERGRIAQDLNGMGIWEIRG
jgi:hypothetical protein